MLKNQVEVLKHCATVECVCVCVPPPFSGVIYDVGGVIIMCVYDGPLTL